MRTAWLVIVAACSSSARSSYPPTPRGEPADDPYRWLEDMDGAKTAAWVAAQNKLALATIGDVPGRDKLHARLAELLAHESNNFPVHRGARYFWTRTRPTDDQPTIQVAPTLDGEGKTLLDPSQFATDGSVQLADWAPSHDGERLLFGLSSGGGDWTRWHVRDVATGKDLPDELPNTKYYAPAFTADGTGLYYSRFPEPAKGKELTEPDHDCKLYFHKLGTPVADDRVVYEQPQHPTWQFEPHITEDGHYLVIAIGDGEVGDSSQEAISIRDLTVPDAPIVPVIDSFTADYVFVGGVGSHLYFKTNANAPNKKIALVDVAGLPRDGSAAEGRRGVVDVAGGTWSDVVPAGNDPIESATLAGGQLLVSGMHDVHTTITAYGLDGVKLRDVELPGLGSAYIVAGTPEDAQAFYYFTSFTTRGSTYRIDLATGKSTPWRVSPPGYDVAALETKQVFFESKDGTKVPMFITARRGLALDGTNPMIMTAYGGFGSSETPAFSAKVIAWIERGGVAVVVNIRGGGEYGDAWHHAAWHEHQQNKLDDFFSAAEWLIAHRWTSPAHLGAYGYSGGGMLIGELVVQRPDLFGAVAPIAGVLDVMRFHLFGQGAGWQAELGHPDVPAEAAYLKKLSPLHNLKRGRYYPAMLVLTSDHDVRVAPLHSYKFAAAAQAAQGGPAPILLRVETETGHGGSGLKSQQVTQETELLSFFAKYLGLRL